MTKYFYASFKCKTFVIVTLILYCLLVPLSYAKISKSYDTSAVSVYDVILNLFIGPVYHDLISGLMWFVPLITLLYFVGISMEEDFNKNTEYLFLRVSKWKWYKSKTVSLLSIVMYQGIILFLISSLFGITLYDLTFNNQSVILDQALTEISSIGLIAVLFATIYLLVLIQMLLTIIFGNRVAFIVLVVTFLFLWFFGVSNVTRFLPSSTSMIGYYGLVENNATDVLTVPFSMIVVLTYLLGTFLIGWLIVKRKDIIPSKN